MSAVTFQKPRLNLDTANSCNCMCCFSTYVEDEALGYIKTNFKVVRFKKDFPDTEQSTIRSISHLRNYFLTAVCYDDKKCAKLMKDIAKQTHIPIKAMIKERLPFTLAQIRAISAKAEELLSKK